MSSVHWKLITQIPNCLVFRRAQEGSLRRLESSWAPICRQTKQDPCASRWPSSNSEWAPFKSRSVRSRRRPIRSRSTLYPPLVTTRSTKRRRARGMRQGSTDLYQLTILWSQVTVRRTSRLSLSALKALATSQHPRPSARTM